MNYDDYDAAMDEFYDRISEELYPEHKEQAIEEFIEERMVSYYLKNPNIVKAPIDSYHHAHDLLQVSHRGALVMYVTATELFLKSVLLRPVLYGMIYNENIADMIVNSSTSQSGFSRYNKLLNQLCYHAANIELPEIKGMDNRPILVEAEEVQNIRNRVIHQGYAATTEEVIKAKSIAGLILLEVVEPVLNNMNLVLGSNQNGFAVLKV